MYNILTVVSSIDFILKKSWLLFSIPCIIFLVNVIPSFFVFHFLRLTSFLRALFFLLFFISFRFNLQDLLEEIGKLNYVGVGGRRIEFTTLDIPITDFSEFVSLPEPGEFSIALLASRIKYRRSGYPSPHPGILVVFSSSKLFFFESGIKKRERARERETSVGLFLVS